MARALIYDNRFFRWLLNATGRAFIRLWGWRVVGEVPDDKKLVFIAAPHTSNWDFPIFMSVVCHFGMRVRFLGKHTLFKGPLGWLFYYLGGIPVDRAGRDASDAVDQAIEVFHAHDALILGIAPEGTRTKVRKWKTGFYRIAVGAGVPIGLAYIDSQKKAVGIHGVFYPTGDMAADMATIQAIYAEKAGVNPDNQ